MAAKLARAAPTIASVQATQQRPPSPPTRHRASPQAAAQRWLALLLVALCLLPPAQAGAASQQLEELTWTELRERVAQGSTTVLVPIGGTEQNGPHMVLGKHNVRVKALAGLIAAQLGNALVAPVMAYVPEGSIRPPAAHMRFAGTLTVSDTTFDALLESTARSLRQHGFRDVVFLGDHGSYQRNEQRVADKLNREWAADPACRVHALLDYYNVTQTGYVAALRAKGFSDYEIGTHAGLADTSLALALDKSLVRAEALAATQRMDKRDGVYGDPHRASAELGRLGVQQIVETSVAAIRKLTQARPQAGLHPTPATGTLK